MTPSTACGSSLFVISTVSGSLSGNPFKCSHWPSARVPRLVEENLDRAERRNESRNGKGEGWALCNAWTRTDRSAALGMTEKSGRRSRHQSAVTFHAYFVTVAVPPDHCSTVPGALASLRT